MKKKHRQIYKIVEDFTLQLIAFILNKTRPLQERYKKYSQTRYGRLIRMDSYHVYPILFLPTWCAIWIADRSDELFSRILLCLLFAIGAFLMRSVGCILNDLADVKFDKQVARTQHRTIASGEVKVSEALKVAFVMSVMSLIILLSLPKHVFFVGIFAAALVAIYPLAKRFTYLAQLVLGFTFNSGILIGWLIVNDNYYFQLGMLYLGFVFLTFAYDTIYACQDLEDDVDAGVKSFPVLLKMRGYDIKATVWNIYKLSITCIGIAGLGMSLCSPFFFGLAGATYMLYNWWETCNIQLNKSCAEHFKKISIFLFILFLGTVFGRC
jgi:4-hydroxybenzoate polyprenyltransferase